MSKRRPDADPAAAFTFRPGRREDLDDLIALEEGFPEADRFSRRTWARLLRSATAEVLIARSVGQATSGNATETKRETTTGAAVVLFHALRPHGRLYSIAVAPWARGRGLGATLLAQAESACRDRGVEALRLEVRASNDAARTLYDRSGFRNLGIKSGYYADGEDAVRYEKNLAASRL